MSAADRRAACTIAAALALSSCASFRAPPGAVPSPVAAQTSVRGGWAELVVANGTAKFAVAGELIAVNADRVWIESPGTGHVWIPRANIASSSKVTLYDWPTGTMTGYAVLGSLSTIANGWFLILTMPTWIISTSVAGATETHRAQAKVGASPQPELPRFCRFPQGMPPELESAYTRYPP